MLVFGKHDTESQEGWNGIDNKVTPTRRLQRKPRNQGEHITPRNHKQAERKPLKTTSGHKTDSSKGLGHKPPTWATPPTESPVGEHLGAAGVGGLALCEEGSETRGRRRVQGPLFPGPLPAGRWTYWFSFRVRNLTF